MRRGYSTRLQVYCRRSIVKVLRRSGWSCRENESSRSCHFTTTWYIGDRRRGDAVRVISAPKNKWRQDEPGDSIIFISYSVTTGTRLRNPCPCAPFPSLHTPPLPCLPTQA